MLQWKRKPLPAVWGDDGYELILKGTDYDELKTTSERIVSELMKRSELTRIHSSMENAAPVVEVTVDAIAAKTAGVVPGAIGQSVYQVINGVEAAFLESDGEDIAVKVQYLQDEFKSVDQIRQLTLTLGNGGYVSLDEIADISFQDSPASIAREDKQYVVTISADYTGEADKNTDKTVFKEAVQPYLTETVNQGSPV